MPIEVGLPELETLIRDDFSAASIHNFIVYMAQLEKAQDYARNIILAEQALLLVSRWSHPDLWAALQVRRGNSLAQISSGNHAQNLREALRCYRQARTVQRRRTHPADWATICYNRAHVYVALANERASNIERAIKLYHLALRIITDSTDPKWADINDGLAGAYLHRIRGGRAENVERAISSYERALGALSPSKHQHKWAMIQNNLGTAYAERLIGDGLKNLDSAERAFKASGESYRRLRKSGVMCDRGLALTYSHRAMVLTKIRLLGRSDGIERVLRLYKLALNLLPGDRFPHERGVVLMNLGAAHKEGNRGHESGDLQFAVDALNQALGLLTPRTPSWAKVQSNLAAVFMAMAAPEMSLMAPEVERAIETYSRGLECLSARDMPSLVQFMGKSLSEILVARQEWNEAFSILQKALAASEWLYHATPSQDGRAREIDEWAILYRRMVQACRKIDSPRLLDAFLWTERERARLTRDQLALIPLAAPPNVPSQLLQEEKQLLEKLSVQDAAARDAAEDLDDAQWLYQATAAGETRERLHLLWNRLAREYDADRYVAHRHGDTPNWASIQEWLGSQERNVAIISYYRIDDELLAFILRPGQEAPECLSLSASRQDVLEAVRHLVDEMHGGKGRSHETWQCLGPMIIEPLGPYLGGVDLLYIIPHGILHYCPIHALNLNGAALLHHFPVAYAPSVGVMLQCSRRSVTEPSATSEALVIGCYGFEEEAQQVADWLGVTPLLSDTATLEEVQRLIPGSPLVHMSTHANFHPDYPLESGIDLGKEDRLTVREMAKLPLSANLVVLSACVTAMQTVQPGDNLLGMPSVLLCCGARSVVASLWPVSGFTTRLLMVDFYRELFDAAGQKKTTTADALRTAMLRMWEQSGQAAYHWAPFILYGDWR